MMMMMMTDVYYTSMFHTWCGGLSANLECRSESDFARLKNLLHAAR